MKRIAIITGASSGMGKCFAQQLILKYTFDELWLIARNKERLTALAGELSVPCRILDGDLSSEEFLTELERKITAEEPDIAVLVNAAGYGKMNKVQNLSREDNIGMIDLNARALFAVTYACLPYMHKGSKIINVGSFSSFIPVPYMSVYAATKAFVLSFTRSLNAECKAAGIHAIALCPLWVKTEFFDRANTDKLVNNYPHPYEAAWVVKKCIQALNGKKDYVVPGLYAKLNHLGTKLLPHTVAMKTFLKQQKLK
jgi:hypothetical protein